jgi:hypothetical protein
VAISSNITAHTSTNILQKKALSVDSGCISGYFPIMLSLCWEQESALKGDACYWLTLRIKVILLQNELPWPLHEMFGVCLFCLVAKIIIQCWFSFMDWLNKWYALASWGTMK